MCQPGRPAPQGDGPRRLAGLGVLPEHEIQRIALALIDLDARTGAQVLESLAREAARRRRNFATAYSTSPLRADVGVAALDQPLDQRDDAGHVLGGARLVVGRLDARAPRSPRAWRR